jgi:hypothetical protein
LEQALERVLQAQVLLALQARWLLALHQKAALAVGYSLEEWSLVEGYFLLYHHRIRHHHCHHLADVPLLTPRHHFATPY